jgi:6-pyruvoyltetrahydropterin/6-carboxytetrahydropterin synthase
MKKIAESLDHFILIPGGNSSIELTKTADQLTITFHQKTYVFPRNDCIILPIQSTSAENLAHFVLKSLLSELNLSDLVTRIEIGVDEGYGQGAYISEDI